MAWMSRLLWINTLNGLQVTTTTLRCGSYPRQIFKFGKGNFHKSPSRCHKIYSLLKPAFILFKGVSSGCGSTLKNAMFILRSIPQGQKVETQQLGRISNFGCYGNLAHNISCRISNLGCYGNLAHNVSSPSDVYPPMPHIPGNDIEMDAVFLGYFKTNFKAGHLVDYLVRGNLSILNSKRAGQTFGDSFTYMVLGSI